MTIEGEIALALHAADCGCKDGEPHDDPYATQAAALTPLLNRVRAEAHDVGYRQAVRDCTGEEYTGPIPSHYRDSALVEALRGLGALSNRELMRQTQEGIRASRTEQGEQ